MVVDPSGSSRIWILSASMGAGHLRLSDELARRLTERGHRTRVIDLLQLPPLAIGRIGARTYPFLVNRIPPVYRLLYATLLRQPVGRGTGAGPSVRLILPGLRRLLAQDPPDLVISTYPTAAQTAGHLRATGELRCPSATVVTTFSVNNLWLHRSNDLEVGITADAAAEIERRTGRAAGMCGPVVAPEYFADPAERRADARRSLELPEDAMVALISTGAVGLSGSAAAAATAIAGQPGWWAVVLCGRDERLRRELAALPRVRALGWTDDMPGVCAAADVLVDNAGGMTSKQALAYGLPLVTFRALPGHGRRDVERLAGMGLTDAVTTVPDLLAATTRLVVDADHRQDRIARGRALFRDDALAPFTDLLD